MLEDIEEDKLSPPNISRPFLNLKDPEFMANRKGLPQFSIGVISEMHSQVLKTNKEQLKQFI